MQRMLLAAFLAAFCSARAHGQGCNGGAGFNLQLQQRQSLLPRRSPAVDLNFQYLPSAGAYYSPPVYDYFPQAWPAPRSYYDPPAAAYNYGAPSPYAAPFTPYCPPSYYSARPWPAAGSYGAPWPAPAAGGGWPAGAGPT